MTARQAGWREPSWWYEPGHAAWPVLLAPLAGAYGYAAAHRMRQQPRYRSHLPVICVGNFTAGGTGKTPLTRLIVSQLKSAGHKPVILSRGYGGAVRGPHAVAARDTAADVGDEPLLLRMSAPVVVSADRVAGARFIEASAEAYTVVVMDDGLQNPALAKTLAIGVVDGRRGFGNGRCMPAGPLRAPLSAQLARCDVIVVNFGHGHGHGHGHGGTEPLPAAISALQFNGPILSAGIVTVGDLGWLHARPVVAYAGIGTPERFFQTLQHTGARLAAADAFGDHHVYTETDAAALLAKARTLDAQLVTTEKDLVRLVGRSDSLGELAKASRALPIEMALSENDMSRLLANVPQPAR